MLKTSRVKTNDLQHPYHVTTVDRFADQIEAEIAVLDRFAPLHRSRRWPSKPVTRWLSTDAIDSSRQRRRLERVWKRAGLERDRIVY